MYLGVLNFIMGKVLNVAFKRFSHPTKPQAILWIQTIPEKLTLI